MIKLYLANYSKGEANKLLESFEDFRELFLKHNCSSNHILPCSKCELRHICQDIEACISYLTTR